ncbi:MAG TPA: DUF3006 domain-containing protein [bacterium]|nr:DUF3006 domain-containing protein [bacterium]HPP87462.1 DUF3006 domain-containing protein [bacterium]
MEKKIQVVVDRIENDIAVLELPDLDIIEIHKKHLPAKVREGNVIDVIFRINKEEEEKRLKEVSELQKELLNRNL